MFDETDLESPQSSTLIRSIFEDAVAHNDREFLQRIRQELIESERVVIQEIQQGCRPVQYRRNSTLLRSLTVGSLVLDALEQSLAQK
ncbi:MAG: hypothetical protein V4629_11555 [Pseudomonadota bacterium]